MKPFVQIHRPGSIETFNGNEVESKEFSPQAVSKDAARNYHEPVDTLKADQRKAVKGLKDLVEIPTGMSSWQCGVPAQGVKPGKDATEATADEQEETSETPAAS